jgi:hypothetical protein
MVVFAANSVWNVRYQNATFLAAYYTSDSMIRLRDASKMSVVFMILSLIGFFVSVPFWTKMGLLYLAK